MTSKTTNKFSPEVRARAVRMVLDHASSEHPSRWAAVTSIAIKIGCTPQTLHDWVKKAEVDSRHRAGVPTDMAEKLKALERENRELRQANEILRKASAYFAMAELDAGPSHDRVHRRSSWGAWGRADLQGLADRPSTYHAHVAKRRDPAKLSERARQDAALKIEVRRVFDQNFSVYGVRKVWRQLKREGFDVARCTVSRLMRDMGLQGVIRGKSVKTTISDKAALCPLDHVNRQSRRHGQTSSGSPTSPMSRPGPASSTSPSSSTPYARRIVGWRASRTAHAGFVLDALEQALHDRRPIHRGGLVHHSDRGSPIRLDQVYRAPG